MKEKEIVKDKVKAPNSVPFSEGSVKSEKTKVVERQGEVEQLEHHCGGCKWYDKSSEREFHRDGIRKGLVECRAICRASKEHTKASGHLVKKESGRPCFERGVYVVPVKGKKEQTAETKQTPVPETKTKTSKKHKRNGTERAVATNGLSGDTKVLQTSKGTNKVVVKDVGEA